jgi:hypothetical protein
MPRIGDVDARLQIAHFHLERRGLLNERLCLRRIGTGACRTCSSARRAPPFAHMVRPRRARWVLDALVEPRFQHAIEQSTRERCSLNANARSRARDSPRSARCMLISIGALVGGRQRPETERAGLQADRRLTERFGQLDDAARLGVSSLPLAAPGRDVRQSCAGFGLTAGSAVRPRY